jgi:hypothetical protein
VQRCWIFLKGFDDDDINIKIQGALDLLACSNFKGNLQYEFTIFYISLTCIDQYTQKLAHFHLQRIVHTGFISCMLLHYQDEIPRRTSIPRLHTALNVAPTRDFIYHLTDNFFGSCPAHPNPLDRSIGNYTLADLHHQYKKYIHKRPEHLLL